jgi:hypothetical protein
MTPDDLAAIDAVIAALEEQGRIGEASRDRMRTGARARMAATMDADLMALMTLGSRGRLVGPWLELTCPKGHKILSVRAVSDGPEQGVWLRAGRKHADRTTKALFENSEAAANPFFGAMPGHPQTSRLTDRRVWECPVARCPWSAPIAEAFLLRLYAEAVKRGFRRVPLAVPTVSR